MSSEWLKVMLEEIALKKAQALQALEEDQRRREERAAQDERSSVDERFVSERRSRLETPGLGGEPHT